MTQESVVALRWILYFDLGLLFGLPLFMLYALRGQLRSSANSSVVLVSLVLVGLGASVLAFAVQSAMMAGVPIWSLDVNVVKMLLEETVYGTAIKARGLALLTALTCIPLQRRFPRIVTWTVMVGGAIALMTLPWTGHGASGEGAKGWVQLVADMLHLLAAGAWLGAIAAFLILFVTRLWRQPEGLVLTSRALTEFSIIGTVLVGTLVVTGIVNAFILVGFAPLLRGDSLYALLLLGKLCLFICMLIMAALNRYRLTPALERAADAEQTAVAAANLHRSLLLEAAFALMIFALVAWLTTLAPPI